MNQIKRSFDQALMNSIRIQKTNRLLSLDVFRGLIIVLMIVVNSQGNGSYPWLLHAEWNGWTLADLVFPGFLFIVGATIVLSLNRQKYSPDKAGLYSAILKRSVILFLLGLFLNAFPMHFDLHVRVYGVLQRIALCYLVCSCLYLRTTVTIQIIIFSGLLLGYWFLMTMVPVPGYGLNQLTPAANWVAYVDQCIFSSPYLLEKTYDPEGLLSTIPAFASTISGVLIGHLLLSPMTNGRKLSLMFVYVALFLLCAWFWRDAFPINKNLWSSSFVLWSSGCSLMLFALCFTLIELYGWSKWAFPFKVFGMNALFAFVVHVMLLKIQFKVHSTLSDGSTENLKQLFIDYLFSGFSVANANLLYSMLFLVLNFLLVLALYRHKLFIRI